LADQIFIFEHGEWDVCDGAHWLDVMNEWGVLMKIRPPARKAEWNGVGGSAGHFSKTARSGAPQLFRSMLKDKTGLYFPRYRRFAKPGIPS
jgi:hypothetical protein